MAVTFENLHIGQLYSRPTLAYLWGYKGYQALARGVVTPRDSNIIILFVTEEKQAFQEQYADKLMGHILQWEGPTDHFAEDRMANAQENGDEIHVFHRKRHHSDFKYLGCATVLTLERGINRPSSFKFKLE
jgi:hypothetical protein